MKHPVTRFKSQTIALKELARSIRAGAALRTGRPFERLGMRPREVLANWLLCAALNAEVGSERYRFNSDPNGGDGIIEDRETGATYPTEHVMVARSRDDKPDVAALIRKQIAVKEQKGGQAYASGKALIVFLDVGNGDTWIPNRVARALAKTHFASVTVVGLQAVHDGEYVYNVTRLDVSQTDVAPIWRVRISPNFDEWRVERLQ